MSELPQLISRFFSAINARDADALGAIMTEDVSYHLIVPHPPVCGRSAVVDALRKSLQEADRVDWEVRSWSATDDLVFVERIDRFWFGDREAAIECTGVFVLRDELISEVRDYADPGTWRSRKEAALNP
jgi:limonene-1,2-epoxide hydrolase